MMCVRTGRRLSMDRRGATMNLVTLLRRVAIVLAFVLGHPEKIRHLRRGPIDVDLVASRQVEQDPS
jgi:hypothetical protein